MRPRQITGRKYKSSTDDEISKMVRQKRAHLQQLQKENTQIKSTMEVHKRKGNEINPLIFKQLHQLYQQTKSLEVKEDSETRRNKVFKQLIEYLEEEQIRARKEQDIRYSTQKASEQKLLKKSEHEAEQILIRQNQEIAKINILRQHVEVSRSQRVVYSNLFKKLQKQIRVYEQQFKQLLLETALIEEKRLEQVNINVGLEYKRKAIEKRTSRVEIQKQIKDDRMQMQTQTTTRRRQREKQKDKQKSKYHNSNNSYNNSYKSYNSYSSKYSDQKTQRRQKQQKQLNIQQYQRLQLFLQTMIVQSQCKDLPQLIDDFESIQGNNQQITRQIQRINAEISEYQDINKISRSNNKFKVLEEDDMLQTIPLCRSNSSILYDKQAENKLLRRDLMRIADMLCIPYSDPIQINQIFSLIQKSLEGFVSVDNLFISEFVDESYSPPRKYTRRGQDQENTVEALIDRAEKYHESEKIFQKQCFEDQYCKEIIRVRRITKSKK